MRPRRWFASIAVGIVTGLVTFGALTAAGAASGAAQAAAGDSSAVTVTAKDQDPDLENAPMPDLAVTVSQTQDLGAQGIRITWTGGKKSVVPSTSNGGANFLQVFMCWGDDPNNPSRPDRTTCEYGGTGALGASRDAYRPMPLADIPTEDQQYSAPSKPAFLPPYTAVPFIARDGKNRLDGITTDPTTGVKSRDLSVDMSNSQFFTSYSTNEIPWVGSGDGGTGAVSFEVQTAAQSDAMGCGASVTVDGVTTGASCWLVVLPRGTSDNGAADVSQSGLFIDSWRHALAVKLGFEPVGSRCPEGTTERQLAGSELVSFAVASWQPVVCKQPGASVYSLLTIPEGDAVTSAATDTDAPLALTSYPAKIDGSDPLRYAPIALSGLTISVAIDRAPNPFQPNLPASYLAAARTQFTSMNLTPRLLAKLLSYSYLSSLPPGADTSYVGKSNPYNITKDPDFLAVNDPEWAAQDLAGAPIADVIVPQGRSDAARAVWAYIGADKDASDFLAGKPDPWGMKVNPWYLTNATNPSGSAFSLDRNDFPKADPVEFTPANAGSINLVTWRPYANDLSTVAYLTLRGDGLTLGGWDPYAFQPKYSKGSRMATGTQTLIGMTTSAAAARYQVVTASLRNPAGNFVSASSSTMLAAASAMTTAGGTGQVVTFDQTSDAAKAAPAAYPLTMPVYAANNPATTSSTLRAAYASFIRYAVSGAAQTMGADIGQLPAGYAPLPQGWVDQATASAAAIEKGPLPPSPTPSSDAAEYIGAQSPSDSEGTVGSTASTSAASSSDQPATSAAAPPSPSGTASGPLSGGTTPDDSEPTAIAYAVPASVAGAAAFGLGIPLLGRRRPL